MSANREQLEVEEGTLRDAQRWSIWKGRGGEDDFTEEDIEMSAYIYSDDADPESFAEECVV